MRMLQSGCDDVTASFTLPVQNNSGDTVNQVTGVKLACGTNGVLAATISQLVGAPVSAVVDLNKFKPEVTDPFTTACFGYGGREFPVINGKVTLDLDLRGETFGGGVVSAQENLTGGYLQLPYTGPTQSEVTAIAQGQAEREAQKAVEALQLPAPACIDKLSLGLSEGSLVVSLTQEGCAPKSASVILPANGTNTDANVVTGGELTCSPDGLVALSLNQSAAAAATIEGDFSKFLSAAAVSVKQNGSSLDCDASNELTLTLAQTNGEDVTLTTSLAKLAGQGGTTDCVSFGEEVVDATGCISEWSFTQDNCDGGKLRYDLGAKLKTTLLQDAATKQRYNRVAIGTKTLVDVPLVGLAPQVVRVFEGEIDVACVVEGQYIYRMDTNTFYCLRDGQAVAAQEPPVLMFVGCVEARAFVCAYKEAGRAYCNNYSQVYEHAENFCEMCVCANGVVIFSYTLSSGAAFEIDVGAIDAAGDAVGYVSVDSGGVFEHEFDNYKGPIKVRFPLDEKNHLVTWRYEGDIQPAIGCGCGD
jgi:hypothetical protein